MAVCIEKLFMTPGTHPNGLQATPDGLWVIDQEDNHAYKLSYEDGSILAKIKTDADRASGITLGDGFLWIASTYNCKILKVDPRTGKTLTELETPGAGVVASQRDATNAVQTGAHGLEWIDSKLWMAIPPSQTLCQVDPSTWKVLKSFQTPGDRPHGLAWNNGYLWLADTNMKEIHKIDPSNGKVVDTINGVDPSPHGMTIYQDTLWYCDADTRLLYKILQ
jgi:sugar lactone lactonase YvrE